MRYLVVIDTNVLVSALLSKYNNAATVQILEAVFNEIIIPVFNDEIIDEYTDVLQRPKFKFDNALVQLLISAIKAHGIFTNQLTTNVTLPDPKDLVFYEVVMAKRKDNAYLVTGNSKHFPHEPFIVTPNELLPIIQS